MARHLLSWHFIYPVQSGSFLLFPLPCGYSLLPTPWFNQLAIFCALLLLLLLLLKGLSGEMKMPRIYPLVKYYTSAAEAVSASAPASASAAASASCCCCSSFRSNENNANRFY